MIFLSLIFLFNLCIYSLLMLVGLVVFKKIHNNLSSLMSKRYGKNTIGIIHPNFNNTTVNERLLWIMLKTMLSRDMNLPGFKKIFIFTDYSQQILSPLSGYLKKLDIEYNAFSKFSDIQIVRIRSFDYVNKFQNKYLQFIAQIILSIEISITCPCNFIIDNSNLPFTYLIFKNFNNSIKILSYQHFSFYDEKFIKNAFLFSSILVKLYRYCGNLVDFVLFNSNQLKSSIFRHFQGKKQTVLHIPCNLKPYENEVILEEVNRNSINKKGKRENIMVSWGQFRPDKNIKSQIDILIKILDKGKVPDLKLNILGYIVTKDDLDYFRTLEAYINSHKLGNYVKIEKDLDFAQVRKRFASAKIGLHTQINEPFSSCLIDMMASGLIVVAHKSGSALHDIIATSEDKITGILCDSLEDYSEQITEIITRYNLMNNLILSAKEWVQTFSDDKFEEKFNDIFSKFLH